jgi:hypothetical protein
MSIDLSSIGTTGFDNTKNYSWTIATATGGITNASGQPTIGTVSGTDFNGLGAGFSLTSDTNNLYLNYTASAVPEPTTILVAGATLLGGLWYRRRSRSSQS